MSTALLTSVLFSLSATADPGSVAAPPVSGPVATVTADPDIVQILHREAAVFPKEARDQHVSAGACVVRVYFDESGIPSSAHPMQCDEIWVESATTAALKYRFAPYVVDGVVRRARYDMAFVYTVSPPVPATGTPPAAP